MELDNQNPQKNQKDPTYGQKCQNTQKNQKDSTHGHIYQLKLLMLFLWRGISQKYSFRLGTEIEQAKKFDDLVFEKINQDGTNKYYLLQAKHKLAKSGTKSKKITVDDLLTETAGDYSLVKYFFSFEEIKKEKLFKGSSIEVIVCTNIGFDELITEKEQIEVEKIEDEDKILDFDKNDKEKPKNNDKKPKNDDEKAKNDGENPKNDDEKTKNDAENPKRYKFKKSVTSKLKPKLINYNITNLAKKLLNCFLNNTSIKHHDKSDIFGSYHLALAEEVINTKTKTFHNKFIDGTGLSKEAEIFRNAFEAEIKIKSIKELTLKNINNLIIDKIKLIDNKQVGLNVSKKFGEGEDKNWPNNNAISDDDIHDFLDHLVFAVNQPNEEELGKILLDEMGKDLGLYNTIFTTMLEWLQGKESKFERFISSKKGEEFINETKQKLVKLELKGLTLEHRENVNVIKFGQDAIQKLGLNDFLTSKNSEKRIFHVITKQETLSVIKVYQFLDDEKLDNYLFLRLSSVLLFQNRVVDIFGGNNDVLVIECTHTESDINNVIKYLGSILDKPDKKIILIARKTNLLAAEFKRNFAEKYIEKHDENNSILELLPESQNKLLEDSKVTFQGKEVKLGDLISQEHLKYLPLGKCIDEEVIYKLIKKEKIEIGRALQDLAEVEKYYIHREFNRQVKIKEDFKKETSSFVVVTDHNQIIKANNDQDIVLISDTEQEFNELCNKKICENLNNHWLSEELIWQKSKGALSNLREFLDEDCIIPYKLKSITDISDKIVVISAEPGMGKSTVLTKLAQKTDNSIWVVRINMNDHTTNLSEIQSFNKNKDQALNFLLEISNLKSPLEKELFINRINNHGKIALLFDGFDEVSSLYKIKVIQLLQILRNTKVEKLWVTTRPHMRNELENNLGVFSYTLKPFSKENQKEFFKKFWTRKAPVINEERLEVFIEKLLDLVSQSIRDKEREFTGVPLQTRMIAEIYEEDAKIFYDSNQDEPNFSKKLSLLDLYQKFIQKKYEIYSKEKKKQDSTNEGVVHDNGKLYELFIKEHELLALNTLFKEKLDKFLSPDKIIELNGLIESAKQGWEKTGIINQINNDSLSFVHRTFAEYFAASWFVNNKHNEKVQDFLRENMFEGGSDVLRNFFDRLLTKEKDSQHKYEIHTEVLNNDKEKVTELLLTDGNVNSLDNGGRTPLLLATTYGYEDIIKNLLDYGADVTIPDQVLGWTPLKYAETGNYWGIAELLLQSGANGNDMFKAASDIKNVDKKTGETILHVAAQKGYTKLAEVLIKKGADINAQNKEGKSPLHCAAENGHLTVVKLLANNRRADINMNTSIGPPLRRRPMNWTPLHYAVFNHHVDVVTFLRKQSAKLIADSIGASPLDIANTKDIIELLGGRVKEFIKASAIRKDNVKDFKSLTKDEDFSQLSGWSCLHDAASSGSFKIVEYLLDNGANVDGKDSCTPLAAAAGYGDFEMVKHLMERGANVHLPGTDGWVPLLAAARASRTHEDSIDLSENDYLTIVKYFVEEKGADVNVVDMKGTTPLHTAAFHNNLVIVKYLVEKHADINAVDKLGASVVLSAAFNNNCEVIKFLLMKGAKVDSGLGLLGALNITVLHIAAMYDAVEIVSRLLAKKSTNVNAGRDISLTALHFAALSNSKESIEYLIEHNADVNVAINFGNIVKIIAEEKNTFEGNSLSVVITRVDQFVNLLPKYLMDSINLTPNMISELFEHRNELLKARTKTVGSNLISRVCLTLGNIVVKIPVIKRQRDLLKQFIDKRKSGNLESVSQDSIIYLPDNNVQKIANIISWRNVVMDVIYQVMHVPFYAIDVIYYMSNMLF